MMILRAGADEKEALFAVFNLGTSNSLFYFSSHLLPYDLAMVFGMLALYTGVSDKFSKSGSFLTGLLGSFAFVTYNGYWSLAVFAIFVHVLYALKFRHRVLVRIIFMLLGFLAPFVAIYFLGMFLSGENWLKEYLTFAGTVVQGDYSEGAVLPFLYLWATEKYLLILLLFLAAIAFIVLPKRPRRVMLWLGGLLFIYGCLSIPSVMMNKFVVYGRLVRQMVPFIALLVSSQ
jgi:Flp pilus assembly pilin Flp